MYISTRRGDDDRHWRQPVLSAGRQKVRDAV